MKRYRLTFTGEYRGGLAAPEPCEYTLVDAVALWALGPYDGLRELLDALAVGETYIDGDGDRWERIA